MKSVRFKCLRKSKVTDQPQNERLSLPSFQGSPFLQRNLPQ